MRKERKEEGRKFVFSCLQLRGRQKRKEFIRLAFLVVQYELWEKKKKIPAGSQNQQIENKGTQHVRESRTDTTYY